MKKVKVYLTFSHPCIVTISLYKQVMINVAFQEELSGKLFEFLVSPHATTDVLLADKKMVILFNIIV